MNIQPTINNQYNFTGIKLYDVNDVVYNLKQTHFSRNKKMLGIDKELDKIRFDLKIRKDCRGDYFTSVVEQGKSTPHVDLKPGLAKVSSEDERVVKYPIGNGKTYDVMYEEIGADAQSRAWEYNFGDRLLGQLQAALDIAKRIRRGY